MFCGDVETRLPLRGANADESEREEEFEREKLSDLDRTEEGPAAGGVPVLLSAAAVTAVRGVEDGILLGLGISLGRCIGINSRCVSR